MEAANLGRSRRPGPGDTGCRRCLCSARAGGRSGPVSLSPSLRGAAGPGMHLLPLVLALSPGPRPRQMCSLPGKEGGWRPGPCGLIFFCHGVGPFLAFGSGNLSQKRNTKFRKRPKGTVHGICGRERDCWFYSGWCAVLPTFQTSRLSGVCVLWVFPPSLWLILPFSSQYL